MRYSTYINGNKKEVIVVSSYAKKLVRGIAKCAPGDEFDIQKGYELAKLRCDLKIAEKRTKRAKKVFSNSLIQLNQAKNKYENMRKYWLDASNEKDFLEKKLKELSISL